MKNNLYRNLFTQPCLNPTDKHPVGKKYKMTLFDIYLKKYLNPFIPNIPQKQALNLT
ncbi:hypothetical protein JN11_00356 [Mucilaginibacter frigoritolerans]|jgi:hypothetical protein|uniref:Uncharacterized protein n=1 Tax=Mucilaginibacter frigoritolerans TaxID=652788 RepID=A0A562UG92_9SPHI|nr:hypothetical protein [Mucilaginibacter frigoritolerans]TWJ04639.1 hypothetical protein JN11_00356 [Mucilaginibacter frigoritolerans]